MVASCMRDIPSDESGDDDDPDLLNELDELGGSDDGEMPSPVVETPYQKHSKPCHETEACAGQDLVSYIISFNFSGSRGSPHANYLSFKLIKLDYFDYF